MINKIIRQLVITLLTFLIFAPQPTLKQVIIVKEVDYSPEIKKLNPRLPASIAKTLSSGLIKMNKKHKIDPKLILAILQTESSLDNSMISSTGDYSVAQINYKIWNKEFKRLGKDKLDKVKLQSDPSYALNKMGEILNIIKSRYPNDPHWYARYHSNTEKYKNVYKNKVLKNYNKMLISLK